MKTESPDQILGWRDSFSLLGGVRSTPTRLMEDHRDAYFFWRELRLSQMTCIHVDAHLDVCDLKTPACEGERRPEVNCGNYLLPALEEGLISGLIWVIPKHLPQGEELLCWTQRELQNWLHLEVEDYMSLEFRDGRVAGSLLGHPFTVCYSDNLPIIEGPIALDIDVDYYLGPEDGIWQSPLQLAAEFGGLHVVALTVAYSLRGGYTPPRHRVLGPLTVLALSNLDEADAFWREINGELSRTVEYPVWMRAAIAFLKGNHSLAYELDAGYKIQPVDKLSAALMRQKFSEAREHLPDLVDAIESQFMQGMLDYRERKFPEACHAWSQLLDEVNLDEQTRVYLLTLYGRAKHEMRDYRGASQAFRKGLMLTRRDSELNYLLARSCAAGGELENAAKYYRKSMKLAPGRLETAGIQLELAEVHLALGQRGLAERLLRRTLGAEVPGFLKLRAESLRLKLALGSR